VAVGTFVEAQPALEALDPREQLAGQERARVVQSQVAPQARRLRDLRGSVAGEEPAPGGRRVEEAERDEPAYELRMDARLAGERLELEPAVDRLLTYG
jgi:hypothetical protein